MTRKEVSYTMSVHTQDRKKLGKENKSDGKDLKIFYSKACFIAFIFDNWSATDPGTHFEQFCILHNNLSSQLS